MRQKQRDSPSRSAAGLTEGGRAGPGSWERDGRCGRPCGCWGEMGAEARWEQGGGGGQYRSAGSRARAGEAAAAPRGRSAPRRVICMLSRPRADSRARGSLARSLTRALLLPPLRRRSPGEPESRRVPKLAREGGNPGGRERGRAPALCRPRRPPFLLPQVHPRPQL
ncbi:unnamed protein product [Rangifer tarandus platyrhynchus]|uniref:Uncharacterized protein n=1 Tax=Rangifer tarandus platyrhynchus TaxID=3082113 RepID=A0ABN9A7U4_RANTA|nr:unnamed protein product [Rangifer tarandus platyrhynchus]